MTGRGIAHRRSESARLLLALVGVLRVVVCPLCAAVVAADGAGQHARHHLAAGPNGGAR